MKCPARYREGITRCDAADLPAALVFRERAHPPGAPAASPQYFRWLYAEQPLRRDEQPALWLCRRGGAVVGQQGALPVELSVDGRRLRAAWAIDLHVEEAWRRRGVGPAMMAHLCDQQSVTLGLDVSDAAGAMMLRGGWEEVGRLPLWVRPLDPAALLRARGRPLPPGVAAALRATAAAGSMALAALPFAAGLRVEPMTAFDARADRLWASVAGTRPVAAVRDSESLGWRFDAPWPRRRAELRRLYLLRRDRLVGHAVLRHGRWREVPVTWLVDCLAEPRALPALLARCVDEARRAGDAALIWQALDPYATGALRLLGFVRFESQMRLLIHFGTDLDVAVMERLRDPRCWLVTRGDADVDGAL